MAREHRAARKGGPRTNLYDDITDKIIAELEEGRLPWVQPCLALNASALIIVHNHPAGDPEPSAADLAMTKEIRNACASLGVILHDHIITGAGRETSLRARGEL